jgi:hypothetical protein
MHSTTTKVTEIPSTNKTNETKSNIGNISIQVKKVSNGQKTSPLGVLIK